MGSEDYHQRVSFDMNENHQTQSFGVAITSWRDILPEIGISVKFIDNFTWIVSFIIVMVISLGLANTLLITFFEREKEFQSLNIIGAKSSWITMTLFVEVFLLGTLAILAGTVIGHLATTYCSIFPINIQLFTGGKPIIMGGMVIQPLVRIYPVLEYYWKVPMMIYLFLASTMIYPLIRLKSRSKNAI
jgi:ABC-type lipoprotein release transport system permease subunit